MTEVTVQLTDENSRANYPFLYNVGERVRSRVDRREGVVENATFIGANHLAVLFKSPKTFAATTAALLESR